MCSAILQTLRADVPFNFHLKEFLRMVAANKDSGSIFNLTNLGIAIGFGLYFAWVSIVHYIYIFGGSSQDLGTPIAAAVSLVSVLFYGWVFLRYRNGNSLTFTHTQNIIICVIAILGTLSLSNPVFHYFVPLLTGIPVAWFRLAYAEYFAEVGGRITLAVVGLAFAVCAAVLILTNFLMDTSVIIVSLLAPIGCTLFLNFFWKLDSEKAGSRRYNTSVHDYWKVAALALIISMLFDITETNLVFGAEQSFAWGLPLGFFAIATFAIFVGILLPKRYEFRETVLYITLICCSLFGAVSLFMQPLIQNLPLLMIVQTLGGYGFVTMLLVSSASIAKQRNMQAGLIFGIVLCCQRLGNSLGEIIGSSIIVLWGSTQAAYAAISLLTVGAYVLILIIFLLQGRNPLIIRLDRNKTNEPETLSDEDQTNLALSRYAQEHNLTQREVEVLLLITENLSMREIEDGLHISKNTLKTHMQRIYQKFGVHGRQELINSIRRNSGE